MQTEQKLTSVSDPNHVDITLANGPTQLSMINGLFILTLSQVRPLAEHLTGVHVPQFEAVVVSRVAMEPHVLKGLVEMITRHQTANAPAAGRAWQTNLEAAPPLRECAARISDPAVGPVGAYAVRLFDRLGIGANAPAELKRLSLVCDRRLIGPDDMRRGDVFGNDALFEIEPKPVRQRCQVALDRQHESPLRFGLLGDQENQPRGCDVGIGPRDGMDCRAGVDFGGWLIASTATLLLSAKAASGSRTRRTSTIR